MELKEAYKVCVGDQQVGCAYTTKERAVSAAKTIGETARVVHCTFDGRYNQSQEVWPKAGVRVNDWTDVPAWNVDEVSE